jgi:hypothetical protein
MAVVKGSAKTVAIVLVVLVLLHYLAPKEVKVYTGTA